MIVVPGMLRTVLFALLSISISLLLLLASSRTSLAETVQEGVSKDNASRSGADVFQQACFTCHGTGFYDAPVIGDVYAWEERLLKPQAQLLETTLQGLNSMPARGGCAECSDEEISAAVRYLVQESRPSRSP